jgi:hypothetical protein
MVLFQGSQTVFKTAGTIEKFLTKFQEVPTKLKNIFKKFWEALKIFGQIPGDLGTLCYSYTLVTIMLILCI